MAVYHLRVQNISRGQGRGVVAAAAYRHGAAMFDDGTGKASSYEGRRDVVHSEFAVPSDAPAWLKDMRDEAGSVPAASEAFWNRLNEFDSRANARLAREIEFSLPLELSREQNLALVREFVSQTFLNDGMVADWAYHDKEGNPHVHVMLTLRPLIEDGFGSAWHPVLDPTTGEHLRSGSGKLRYEPWAGDVERVIAYRQAWAEVQNRHLAMAGVDARVSHESYKAQGIEAEPTRHLGPKASAIRRAGKQTIERDRLSPEAKAANRDLFLAEPGQVLKIITRERSVFDARDVARTVHRLVDDRQAFEIIRLRVMASAEMVELAPRLEDVKTDQELSRARYTTADMLDVETRMMERAAELGRQGGYAVAPDLVEGAIRAKPFLAADQRAAIRRVTGDEHIAAVVGFAGAGKSTMLAAAREAWEAQGYRVRGAALAGKATEGLEQSSGIRSRTLASWEHAWAQGPDRLSAGDVLVIDEAGMVASRQMERFVSAARETGAKLVLVGDAAQLQPIEAGAAFRAITEEIGYAELTGVRRQREEWAREASVSFAQGRVGDALDAYSSRGLVRFSDTREEARSAILDGWMQDRSQGGSTLILAHTNADVYALNEGARERLKACGDLAHDASFLTARGTRRFAQGDRVLFLENDRTLGVKNGMLGTVEAAEPGRLKVAIDSESGPARTVEVESPTYNNLDWGYAATIHKSQGATVDRVRVLASPTMDRHLAYVAMSRHRDSVVLHAGRDDFRDVVVLASKLSRSGAKEVSTDYTRGAKAERFAERRGVVTRREVLPALVAFARRQREKLAAMRAQLGHVWSRAEAAFSATRAAQEVKHPDSTRSDEALQGAPEAAGGFDPGTAPRADAAPPAASVQPAPDRVEVGAEPVQRSPEPTPRTAPSARRADLLAQARAAAARAERLRAGRLEPAPAATTPKPQPLSAPGPLTAEAGVSRLPASVEQGEREPALVEPLREFDETASGAAKRAVSRSAGYAKGYAELAGIAGRAYRDPAPILDRLVGALDRDAGAYERHVDQLLGEAERSGALMGKTGLFASRADKDLHTASRGRARSLKLNATTFHAFVHRERKAAEDVELRRRRGVARTIPMPSERLRGVLSALNAVNDVDRPGVVASALRDRELGRELWGFAKAVGERFGAAPSAPSHVAQEGEQDLVAGLSRTDQERLAELRPLIQAGRLAAREIADVERAREQQRLARTLDLSQEQDLSPGL